MNRLRALLLLVALAAAPAAAADDRLLLAGSEAADDAWYAYAGVVLPGPGREAGRGLLQRYWVDRFGYEYDGAPGRVRARATGAEASAGWGTSSARGWSNVWVGARYTNTALGPDDPGATARGAQVGLKLQVETEQEVAPRWRVGGIASFVSTQGAYWARAAVTRRGLARTDAGLELTAGGNDESRSISTGLFGSFRPVADWTVGVGVGARRERGESAGAYLRVNVGHAF